MRTPTRKPSASGEVLPALRSRWMRSASISVRSSGSCNVLVVVPHGFPDDDRHTEILGCRLAEELDSFAVVNNRKYRRPRRGEAYDVDRCVLDLNKPEHAQLCFRDYLSPLLVIIKRIEKEFSCPPLVLFVHGMNDSTAEKTVGGHIGDSNAVFALGAGYAVDHGKTPPPVVDGYRGYWDERAASASRELIREMLNGLRSRLGPGGDGVPGFGATRVLPAFLRKLSGSPVEAVQLEIRWTGFRDTMESLVACAQALAEVLNGMEKVERKKTDENPSTTL